MIVNVDCTHSMAERANITIDENGNYVVTLADNECNAPQCVNLRARREEAMKDKNNIKPLQGKRKPIDVDEVSDDDLARGRARLRAGIKDKTKTETGEPINDSTDNKKKGANSDKPAINSDGEQKVDS